MNDDPDEGEILLEIPLNYILEMICDWWAFSWRKKDLSEIFSWYDEHQNHIKLAPKTRETVEDILWELRGRLGYNVLAHHGIKGQKWGIRNGPPYPIEKSKAIKLKNANNDDIIEVNRATITGGHQMVSHKSLISMVESIVIIMTNPEGKRSKFQITIMVNPRHIIMVNTGNMRMIIFMTKTGILLIDQAEN